MTLPLCRDCKWVRDIERPEFAKCVAPKNRKVLGGGLVLVNPDAPASDINLRWTYCAHHRSRDWFNALTMRFCGRSGRWFEPKEDVVGYRTGSVIVFGGGSGGPGSGPGSKNYGGGAIRR